MQTKRKRDILILSVAVVALGALGAMTLGPSVFRGQPAPATKAAPPQTAAETPADATPPFEWTSAGLQRTSSRDPFSVPIPMRLTGGSSASSGPSAPAATGPAPLWDFPAVTPWGPPTAGGTPTLTTSTPTRAAQPAAPVLTGTLLGDETLALINYAGERLIVRRGDWIAAKYLIVDIGPGYAVLTDGLETVQLTLGGGATQ